MSATIFEIAVYRLAFDAWADDTDRRMTQRIEASLRRYRPEGEPTESHRRTAQFFAEWTERPYGWDYNEIVAWIRLVHDGPGPVIKGYLFPVAVRDSQEPFEHLRPQRRFARGFHPFPFMDGDPTHKCLEEWFDDDASDADICRQLRSALLELTGPNGELPRRHVDLRAFDGLSPYISWRDLIGLRDA
jgi:hypothetical protein